MNCLLYADGTRIDTKHIIGNGLDGIIIHTGSTVLKSPKLYGTYYNGAIKWVEENRDSLNDLEQEKKIYARLQGTVGVANCIETSHYGITLEYYPNGSLEHYVEHFGEADFSRKQNWINEAVEVVARCHGKRVLISDIALRNFVLAEDWSLRIVDFANSIVIGDNIDMSEADEDGCTARLDMLHLGNIIYSIITWRKFSIDCVMESEWPDISELPLTNEIPFGHIVTNCWNRHYTSIQELLRDLEYSTEELTTSESLICSV